MQILLNSLLKMRMRMGLNEAVLKARMIWICFAKIFNVYEHHLLYFWYKHIKNKTGYKYNTNKVELNCV